MMRSRPIRLHLMGLVFAAVIPVLLFGVIVAVLFERQHRASLERSRRDTARALTVAVDHELISSLSTLRALVTSEHLDTGDLRLFYESAQRVLRAYQDWRTINLSDRSGQHLISPLRLFGTPLYLRLVRKSTQQMGRLIADLLTFSRLSRQPLNEQPIVLTDLVHQVLEDLRAEHAGRRVDIVMGDLPVCRADVALWKQVLINLLSNAIKFTEKREVTSIEVGCQRTDDQPAYFIKDNGIDFDMRYAHRLFGVLQRLHSAEEYEDTGVGLAIVQRIIHRHGGRIWAEAAVDQGATFYFTLGGDTRHA